MEQEDRRIYIQSQIACAMIEMEAMKAENHSRLHRGEAMAYGEEQILALIERYGIHHNAVIGYLTGRS